MDLNPNGWGVVEPSNAPTANNQNPPVAAPKPKPKASGGGGRNNPTPQQLGAWIRAGLQAGVDATNKTYLDMLNPQWGSALIDQASLAPGYGERIRSRYEIGVELAKQRAADARDQYGSMTPKERHAAGFTSAADAYAKTLQSGISALRDQTGMLISANAGSGKMGRGAVANNPAAQLALQQATAKWLQPYLGGISDPNQRAAAVQSISAIPAYATIQNQIALANQQGTQSGYPDFVDPYTEALMAQASASGQQQNNNSGANLAAQLGLTGG